jgi:hypothetical protein
MYGQEARRSLQSRKARRRTPWEVGVGNPAERRPPPGVTGVPRLDLVVKLLARLADLVILGPTARPTINIEVGHGAG